MSTLRRVDRDAVAREPQVEHTADDILRTHLDEVVAHEVGLAHADVDDALDGVKARGVQRLHGLHKNVNRRGVFRWW